MPYIIADPIFRDHKTGPQHPESPKRYDSVMEAVKGYPIVPARDATEEDILRCHTKSYLETVKRDVKMMTTLSTGDVEICPESYAVAVRAAGAVLVGVDLAMQGKSSFCAVRPPGHHACSDAGMGFCIFNNIAIGARYAQKVHGVEKVLIVDWDVHHGNGTQEIFYTDSTVFYFSTHQYPLYPGTGAADECGVGCTLNVPIAAGEGSRECVLEAFQGILQEKIKVFNPDLVMVSAGFDAHESDPLGGMNLKTEDYATLTRTLKGPIVSVLEGGYNLEA